MGGGGGLDGKLSASTPFHLVPGTEMQEGRRALFAEEESQDSGSTRILVSLLPYCKWPGFLADRELSHRRLLGLGVKGAGGPSARALWILVSFVLREKLH